MNACLQIEDCPKCKARDSRQAMRVELDVLREAIYVNHWRMPADSPFNNTGRDVCSTCHDGEERADWPCPTFAAAEAN